MQRAGENGQRLHSCSCDWVSREGGFPIGSAGCNPFSLERLFIHKDFPFFCLVSLLRVSFGWDFFWSLLFFQAWTLSAVATMARPRVEWEEANYRAKNPLKGKLGIGGFCGGPQGFWRQHDGRFNYFVGFFLPIFSVVVFVSFGISPVWHLLEAGSLLDDLQTPGLGSSQVLGRGNGGRTSSPNLVAPS